MRGGLVSDGAGGLVGIKSPAGTDSGVCCGCAGLSPFGKAPQAAINSPRRAARTRGIGFIQICWRRSRRLLVTTNTLLKAIAPAARIGLRKPSAAAGIRRML